MIGTPLIVLEGGKAVADAARPCRKCGATDRYPSGPCRPCGKANSKRWQEANPERARATNDRSKHKHADKNRARAVIYRKTAQWKGWHLRRYYGLSLTVYQKLLGEQGGRCAICRAEPTPERWLAVDHDHSTGDIRGLLCMKCNHGLGMYDDAPGLLRTAATYLESPPAISASERPEQLTLETTDDVA